MQQACWQTTMKCQLNRQPQHFLSMVYTSYGLRQMFEMHSESHALNASKEIHSLTHKILSQLNFLQIHVASLYKDCEPVDYYIPVQELFLQAVEYLLTHQNEKESRNDKSA